MDNEIRNIVNALVTAIVTSDAFKDAVKQQVAFVVQEQHENRFSSDEFKSAINNVIDEYDFSNTIQDEVKQIDRDDSDFESRVHQIIEDYDFDEKVEDVVKGMTFTVEVSRY